MTKISLLLGVAAGLLPAQSQRGKYLVEEVGKCADCHTPMLPGGKPDLRHHLKGATLEFQPIHPVPGWRAVSPDLTPGGPLWQNWGEAALVKYMQTGLGPSGRPAAPPMPAYHLTPQDAAAVAAYLKTLR